MPPGTKTHSYERSWKGLGCAVAGLTTAKNKRHAHTRTKKSRDLTDAVFIILPALVSKDPKDVLSTGSIIGGETTSHNDIPVRLFSYCVGRSPSRRGSRLQADTWIKNGVQGAIRIETSNSVPGRARANPNWQWFPPYPIAL